nr:MAG TPA: hypothetical protein [Caudoviricetes sp.]
MRILVKATGRVAEVPESIGNEMIAGGHASPADVPAGASPGRSETPKFEPLKVEK